MLLYVNCTGDKEQVKEAVEEKKASSQAARVEPTAHCQELLDMNSPEGKYRGAKWKRTPQMFHGLQKLNFSCYIYIDPELRRLKPGRPDTQIHNRSIWAWSYQMQITVDRPIGC